MGNHIQPVFYISWAIWLAFSFTLIALDKRKPLRWPRFLSFISLSISSIAIFTLFLFLVRDFKSESYFFIENYRYPISREAGEITIGNDEKKSAICLENPSAASQHVKLNFNDSYFQVSNISEDKKVDINGKYLNSSILKEGDEIRFGERETLKIKNIGPPYPLGRSITVSISGDRIKQNKILTLHTLLNKKIDIRRDWVREITASPDHLSFPSRSTEENGEILASLMYEPHTRVMKTSIYYAIFFIFLALISIGIFLYLKNHLNGGLLLLMILSLPFAAGLISFRHEGYLLLGFIPIIFYIERKRKTRWKWGSVLVVLLFITAFTIPFMLDLEGDFIISYTNYKNTPRTGSSGIQMKRGTDSFNLYDKKETLLYGKTYNMVLGHTQYGLHSDKNWITLTPRDPERIKVSPSFHSIIDDLSLVKPGNDYIYLTFPHVFEEVSSTQLKGKDKFEIKGNDGSSITLSRSVNRNYILFRNGLIFFIMVPFWCFQLFRLPISKRFFSRFFKKILPDIISLKFKISNTGDEFPGNMIFNVVYFLVGVGYVLFGSLALYNNSFLKNFTKFRESALPLFVLLFIGILYISRHNRILVFLYRLLRQKTYHVPFLVFLVLIFPARRSWVFLVAGLAFIIFVYGFRLRRGIIYEFRNAHSYTVDIKKLIETPVCDFESRENKRLFFGLGALLDKAGWNCLLGADLLLLLALFFIILQLFLGGELGVSVGGFLFLPIELGKILLTIYFADWVSRIDKGMKFNVLWVYGLVMIPFILLVFFLKDFSPLTVFIFVFFYHVIRIDKPVLFKLSLIIPGLFIIWMGALDLNNYVFPRRSLSAAVSLPILFMLVGLWKDSIPFYWLQQFVHQISQKFTKRFRKVQETGFQKGFLVDEVNRVKRIFVSIFLILVLVGSNYFIYTHRIGVPKVLGDRISVWLNPWQDFNLSYQYINSVWLMKGAGLYGRGIEALTDASQVPVIEKDLSFSLFTATTGIIGAALLLITLFLVAAAVRRRVCTPWHRYVLEFLVVIFTAQFLVPAMYVSGILPLMGQPLPFISYSNNMLLLFALPFSLLMVILSRPSSSLVSSTPARVSIVEEQNKQYDVSSPPVDKTFIGFGWKRFFFFCIIILILVSMVVLRLISVSFPRDKEEGTQIVYLESFTKDGKLFSIRPVGDRFRLIPTIGGISVVGKKSGLLYDIENNDLIFVQGRKFQFKVYPGRYVYKEVYRQPLITMFPGPYSVKNIGGWISRDRTKVPVRKQDREFLKNLAIELGSEEMKKFVSGSSINPYPLLELQFKKGKLIILSSGPNITRLRGFGRKEFLPHVPIPVRAGDIIRLHPVNVSNGIEPLDLKFDFSSYDGAPALSISYRERGNFPYTTPLKAEAAVLKSIDTGMIYEVSPTDETLFIGERGLYSFHMTLSDFTTRMYIPDSVPQGRVLEMKELLENRMYFREKGEFQAVTNDFLKRVRIEGFDQKGNSRLDSFFKTNKIKWRTFNNIKHFGTYEHKAIDLIDKMQSKGVFFYYKQEIGKLNFASSRNKAGKEAPSIFEVKNNRLYLSGEQAPRPTSRTIQQFQKPFVVDSENNILAYSSQINGRYRRFYTSDTPPDILYLLGSNPIANWGLEQIFSPLYKQGKVSQIQLTINSNWQQLTLEAMREQLLSIRDDEIKSGKYIALNNHLMEIEERIDGLKLKLKNADRDSSSEISTQLGKSLRDAQAVKEEMDKEKNRFYEAAVILMDEYGRILTAASYPNTPDALQELNPEITSPFLRDVNPYLNRAWKWKYNPGSTAKILDSIAFLSERSRFPYLDRLLTSINAFSRFPREDLKGSVMLNGKEVPFNLGNFQGHNIPGGFCSLEDAFAHSYNTYFSYLALHINRVLTVDSMVYDHPRSFITRGSIPAADIYRDYPILEYAERLLMNRKIDLLQNLSDTPIHSEMHRLPNDALMSIESVFPVNAYTQANVAHYSIGQGDFQLTALQNALVSLSVLNDGVIYYPSIIRSVTFRSPSLIFSSPVSRVFEPDPAKQTVRVYSAEVAAQIKEAMKQVVLRGTAGGVFGDLMKGRTFYAKTGTAETGISKDNAIFTGFVEMKDGQKVVFSVIVPRSGLGARIAGKLTAEIFRRILDYENSKGNAKEK